MSKFTKLMQGYLHLIERKKRKNQTNFGGNKARFSSGLRS